jgi:hypothetical protein
MNRSVSTVVNCWQAWSVKHRDSGAQVSGRPRRTTDRQVRHLRFLAFRDRHMSTSSVATAWLQCNGSTNFYANDLSSNKILGPPQLPSFSDLTLEK